MKLGERLLKFLNKKYEPAWMVAQMDSEGFCACAVECPASVPLETITRLNREYLTSKLISPGNDS